MPATSEKQRRFAGMSMSPAGRHKLRASGKKPMPHDVARDFAHKLTDQFAKRRKGSHRGR